MNVLVQKCSFMKSSYYISVYRYNQLVFIERVKQSCVYRESKTKLCSAGYIMCSLVNCRYKQQKGLSTC